VGYFQISLRELTLVLGLSLFASFLPSAWAADHPMSLEPARRSITTNELMQHGLRLASDELAGRAPSEPVQFGGRTLRGQLTTRARNFPTGQTT
jgi:hypothetical protein